MTLAESRPGSAPFQISSEAMELAVSELEDRLHAESSSAEADPLTLDAAMAFIKRVSPKR